MHARSSTEKFGLHQSRPSPDSPLSVTSCSTPATTSRAPAGPVFDGLCGQNSVIGSGGSGGFDDAGGPPPTGGGALTRFLLLCMPPPPQNVTHKKVFEKIDRFDGMYNEGDSDGLDYYSAGVLPPPPPLTRGGGGGGVLGPRVL
jgi:hypothetical protein